MSAVVVQGGRPLEGAISVAGAKNAVLPLMAATILTERPVEFTNVPRISDVQAMQTLLESYGVEVNYDATHGSLCLTARNVRAEPADPTVGRTFRGSILVLGPLLARLGPVERVRVYRPGGDDFGDRGVNYHLSGLREMGASIQEYSTYIDASAPKGGLQAPCRRISWPRGSVGATQNITMAACTANGTTTIERASIEPETLDMVELLKTMGANVEVDKCNRVIRIRGKPVHEYSPWAWIPMSPIRHAVIPDRIEAGTYVIAAAITGGRIELRMAGVSDQMISDVLGSQFWQDLSRAGIQITRTQRGIMVERRRGTQLKPVSITTGPYPDFPTDLHPQWAALMCFGTREPCSLRETVFRSRFAYVELLQRMGADIYREDDTVFINTRMVSCPARVSFSPRDTRRNSITVEATDIRAGAALILAALAKNEVTTIEGISHVNRGYENIVEKLHCCGADIWRV